MCGKCIKICTLNVLKYPLHRLCSYAIIFNVRVEIKLKAEHNKFARRCGRCQTSVRFAERDRFPETTYPTQTDIQEESGMRTSRLYELMTTEQ